MSFINVLLERDYYSRYMGLGPWFLQVNLTRTFSDQLARTRMGEIHLCAVLRINVKLFES